MAFLSRLSTEKTSQFSDWGKPLWMLREPLLFQSKDLGLITVPEGFLTDYASVPRLPLTFWLTGDTAHASAVIHDFLVSPPALAWERAASIFLEAMEAENIPWWRRKLMYWGVLLAGPKKKDPPDAEIPPLA